MGIPIDIERIARNVRRTILRRYGRPDGYCYKSACIIRIELHKVNITSRVCCGYYGGLAHFWILCKGYTLDVTSDQFPGGRAIVWEWRPGRYELCHKGEITLGMCKEERYS